MTSLHLELIFQRQKKQTHIKIKVIEALASDGEEIKRPV